MIYNEMEFHNVVQIDSDEKNKLLKPRRYPAYVRNALEGDGKWQAEGCKGCEIRFVTEAEEFKINVSAGSQTGDIVIFKGDYFHSVHRIKADSAEGLNIKQPERFGWVKEEVLNQSRFSPKVWRVFIDIHLINNIEIDTFGHAVRPPEKGELPLIKWLAYGSSITYGVGAINNHNSYIQQAARRMKVDVYNMGLSGSCYCEKEVADFIAGREDWDFVTLEIGVNMRSVYSEEQFRARAEYLMDQIIERHPNKPVVVITIFPNHAIYSRHGSIYEAHHIAYIQILRELVEKKRHRNLHLISGENILRDFSGLAIDLIHPADAGHILMGENLAREIEKIIY